MKFSTKIIHVGEEPNFEKGSAGDVVAPIHMSSTFARRKVKEPTNGYKYSRSGNPTRDALEKKLAALENAKFGLAFASGLAAETTLLLSLVKPGDHIIAFDDLYGGTRRLFKFIFNKNFKVEITYVDATNSQNIMRGMKKNTRLIWLESPTNPLMKLSNIKEASKIAHTKGTLLVVDNTFASPYIQQPLNLGADIVVHSTTKYINGHSDSIGGAIMLSDTKLHESIKFIQNAAGAILSPFDSYLVMRGIKTLAIRIERHNNNAYKIAKYLANHPKVKKVYYPGLRTHPQHELAKKQMNGFGGMLSFELKGGIQKSISFLENLQIFAVAESLGGVESLAEHPAIMTHASILKEEREKIGITDALVRLSVGIEDVEDLLEDLAQALKKA